MTISSSGHVGRVEKLGINIRDFACDKGEFHLIYGIVPYSEDNFIYSTGSSSTIHIELHRTTELYGLDHFVTDMAVSILEIPVFSTASLTEFSK